MLSRTSTSETSIDFYEFTRRKVPETGRLTFIYLIMNCRNGHSIRLRMQEQNRRGNVTSYGHEMTFCSGLKALQKWTILSMKALKLAYKYNQ
jgi:hypothetical protein